MVDLKNPFKFIKNLKNIVEYKTRMKRVTAANPRHSDIYVVEFPKSGITWLSVLLANAALKESGRSEVANFFNSRMFVPDIHVSRQIADPVYCTPSSRLIKSHSELNYNYGFVIYLVRHPVNVLRSYFRYQKEVSGFKGSFEGFCDSNLGVSAWKRHVTSWLRGPVIENRRLYLLKYEDLLKDPTEELKELSSTFGWSLSEESIKYAVSHSSASLMRRQEQSYKKRNPRYTMTFVKGGRDESELKGMDDFIEKECAEELKVLGYL